MAGATGDPICSRRILIHQFTLRVEAGGAEGFEDEVGNAEGAEE